jgi:hypothetical protein
MIFPGVSALSPSGGRDVAGRYPTALVAGEVAPEAVMSSATLGSNLSGRSHCAWEDETRFGVQICVEARLRAQRRFRARRGGSYR